MFLVIDNSNGCQQQISIEVQQDMFLLVVDVGVFIWLICMDILFNLDVIGFSQGSFLYNWFGLGLFFGIGGFYLEVQVFGIYVLEVINI